MTVIATHPRAPYSLEPTTFPFPALATMAGRAPLGGPREIAMACFVVARMVHGVQTTPGLTVEQRQSRAQGAKHWLASTAIATPFRSALSRLADATVDGDSIALKAALDSVMTITANQLDSGARLELGRLTQAVAG